MILPSSHTGGPRFMAKLYQNSMAIVRHLGKPSLFITFTANPNWQEIKDGKHTDQFARDRPDIVARVFDLKVKELLKEIKEKEIFGPYKGLVRTIEYQKRGLPHLHLLLFLDRAQSINTVEQINEVISAEIPSKAQDPELYEIVTTSMVHGPCGDLDPTSPCMVADNNGVLRCSKRFPKPLSDVTIVNENGYPSYKRPHVVAEADRHYINNPLRGVTGRIEIDNRWIVPYNAYLSKKYKAHINVECCHGVASVKYINKYVYKGSDRTTLRLSETQDEIERYLQGRYIGPTEAFARIFEYKMHEEDPTVTTLCLHLPNEQPVYFDPNSTPQQIREKMRKSVSMLMGYFEYYTENNPVDEEGNRIVHLYQDFPQQHVWNNKKWKPREKGFAIGRIPYCNPTCGERYYLRLLLNNISGSTSFEDLRTINGTLFSTFKEACLELHLIQDDREWLLCFNEAQRFSSGNSLRNLFVLALTFGQISGAELFWLDFCVSMCDDLDHRLQQLFPDNDTYTTENDDLFYNGSPTLDYGLYLIDIKLNDQGRTLQQFSMPQNEHNWLDALNNATTVTPSFNRLMDEQLSYSINDELIAYQSKYDLFNVDQRVAFDRIIQRIGDPTLVGASTCFFLHGPAGTGKTFVYNTIANYFRSQSQIVLCVASSGIAALLLVGGRTSHSRLKIPLQLHETSTCNVTPGSALGVLLYNTALIIWDEVPMQHRHCFEAVDRVLRDIRRQDTLFGGIPVIFGGDFAQIAPVIKRADRSQIVDASIRQSYIWDETDVIHLRVNMRVRGTSSNDAHFKDWLYRMTYSPEMQNKSIPLPHYIYNTSSLNNLIERVYPMVVLSDALNSSQRLYKSAILTTRNDTADELNGKILDSMPGTILHLLSADEAVTSPTDGVDELFQISPEYLQTLNPNNFPPARLSLKVGCIVMLLRNINAEAGLCNGTRLMIKEIGSYVLKVAVLKEINSEVEQIEMIPRITLDTMEDDYPFILRRTQFPVKLSFAMTINKSQGQSLQYVGIDMRYPVFSHGQLYVAMSRSTRVDKIYVLHPEEAIGNKVENIVYPELLL